MDWSKYPLDKLLEIVAAVIPGSVALLIYHAAIPTSFSWFWALPAFGYRTKLASTTLAAFIAGITVNAVVSSFLGAIGNVVGSASFKPAHEIPNAPWRSKIWRAALSRAVAHPPNDTQLWTKTVYDLKRREAESMPGGMSALALAQLEVDRLQNQAEDREWQRWYDRYSRVLLGASDNDTVFHVRQGLYFNFETASLYTFVSLFFVPAIRHWWCILPACFWVFMLVVIQIEALKKYTNKWSTFEEQLQYLNEHALSESLSESVSTAR